MITVFFSVHAEKSVDLWHVRWQWRRRGRWRPPRAFNYLLFLLTTILRLFFF